MNRSLLSLFILVSALSGAGCVVGESNPNAACEPNPCREANRTTCVVELKEARCLCDAGFIARPSGACEPVSASNCAEHGGDTFEPDDCLARAQPLASNSGTRQQTIDPAGDYDFFQFSAAARELFSISVRVDGGALMPRVDVFDQGGEWLAAGEDPGRTDFFFRADVASIYFARVSHSPVDPSVGTGGYSLSFNSLGEEDHGDFAEDATRLTPEFFETTNPASHYGRFEYPRDTDWFTFSASSSREYRLSFEAGTRIVPAVAVYSGSNLNQPLFTDQNATVYFSVPAGGTAFVVVYSPNNSEGSYAFNFLYRDK